MKPFGLALLGLALLVPGISAAQETRVLIVGDSWAEEMWEDGSHATVFPAYGLQDILVDGSTTTESGSTANEWKQGAYLQLIADALDSQPSIDTVQLTVGGNDFLDTWNTGFDDKQLDALKDAILFDLNIIIDFILGKNPDIEVILSFYDYPNFVDTLGDIIGALFCEPLFQDLGEPEPVQINEVALEFESLYEDLADDNPRVHFASHFGLMQFHFGFPDDGIPPGQLEPPGDITLPSPVEAMRDRPFLGRDCFHLEPAGYDILVENLVENYYLDRFSDPEATVTIEDLVQTYDGSPRPVSVETDPVGLNVTVTYDGQTDAPVEAGDYNVLAVVDEDGWTGQAEAVLVIEQAGQSISFELPESLPADAPPLDLTASADSGLEVEFELISGPASIQDDQLILDGKPGTVVVEASQPGDDNWLPAEPVNRTVEVAEVTDDLFSDRFENIDGQ